MDHEYRPEQAQADSKEAVSELQKEQIQEESPDRPAPFDPFANPHLPDGGSISQDQTELAFESVIGSLYPTAPTPNKPTIESGVDNVTPNSIDLTDDGSLIAKIYEFAARHASSWIYELEALGERGLCIHNIHTDPSYSLEIVPAEHGFKLNYDPSNEFLGRSYQIDCFAAAFGGTVELIDWGSLPGDCPQPTIWEYNGFDGNGAFTDYINPGVGRPGKHEFNNTTADYKIIIKSYEADGQETYITILSIFYRSHVIYRQRYPGQKQAFEHLFTLLDNNLSHLIAFHEARIGDSDAIPEINQLLSLNE